MWINPENFGKREFHPHPSHSAKDLSTPQKR